ncbi:MFS transporter [Streptomyces sp. bgisy084]|uniref:MFS transporter n=1 Tax=unclassified Streptomyces TaxID=2593676 RepID=UPI003D72ADF0
MISEQAAPHVPPREDGTTAPDQDQDQGQDRTRLQRQDPTPPPHRSRDGVQLLVLALGFVMASLDTGIMNIAANDLRSRLGLTMSGLTWVVDGYVLAFAALLLLAGSLAKRFGARRIYLVGLAVFTAASLLGAVAPNGAVLVAARFVQGLEGPGRGWSAPYVLGAFAVAAVALAGLLVRERVARTPVLPVSLFADRGFTAANVVGFLFNFAFYGALFVLGLFLQGARGASPVTAGLQMLPAVLVLPFGNMLYARFGPRLGDRTALTASLALSTVGYVLLFLILAPGLPYWVLAVVLAVANLGGGVSSPALTGVLMAAAGREHADIGSATLNANRQIGSLVGIAGMGAVLTGAGGGHQGAAWAFALTAGALAVAVVAGRTGLRTRT